MPAFTGGCLCGRVRYRLTGSPLIARVCWCRTCQKLSANGTANAIFRSEAIAVDGQMSCFASQADSGNQISRHFCPNCGSHLFANSDASPEFRVVRLGTLDDPSSIAPTLNMWTDSAPRWAKPDPALKVERAQPTSAAPKPSPNKDS